MITAEKHNQCPSVINCYRKILGKNKQYFKIFKFDLNLNF